MQDDPVREHILELPPLLDNNAEAAATPNTYIASLWGGPQREERPRGPAEGLNRPRPGRGRRRAAKYARTQYLHDNRRSNLATCILERRECDRPSAAADMDKITAEYEQTFGVESPPDPEPFHEG